MFSTLKRWIAWLIAWFKSYFKGDTVMSALAITPPFPTFSGKDGLPLEDGYIWIGSANQNPQTSPVVAYWDETLTQIAQQPIRTLGGYPAYSGTPARLFIGAAVYSILVQDKNANTVYNSPSNTGASTFVNFAVSEEVQVATAGQTVFTLANTYTPGTNSLTVYVDGVNQYDGAQYSFVETSGDTVTFTSGLHVGALVKFSTAIQLSGGVADSSQVTYVPAGTGAVTTNVQTKLRETVSVKDFGAVGDGVTDDTVAIQAATSYIQSIGGGAVYFPQGTYKIYSNGSTSPLGNFLSLNGLSLIFDGAELVIDRTFTGVETIYVFVFNACKNIKISNIIASCTETQPAFQKTSRGAYLFQFLGGCENISADNTYADSLRAVWNFHREPTDPISYVSKVIDIGCTTAVDCGYPLLGSLSGDNLHAQLSTLRCGRSYFFSGASDHVVHLRSTNHEASIDCLLATDAGQGMQDVDLKYVNLDSTTNDVSIACVRVEYQDSDLFNGIHKNIKVDFNIQTVVGVSALGYAFEISKVTNSDLPDPTDRGHVLDGVTLTGNIDNPSGRGIAMCSIGTWGVGEFVRNIKIDNLRCVSGSTQNLNLPSLKNVATIQNLTSNTAVETVGNTVGKITYINCDIDGATTSNTSDTSLIDYHSCNIRSAVNQSRINKAFFNTYIGTELVTSFRGTYNAQIPLAAAAIVSLTPPGNNADVAGILDVVDGNGDIARFALNGASNTTQEVNDPSSKYSVTAGAVSINVYWSAGNGRYEIENGTASGNSVRLCVTYFAA